MLNDKKQQLLKTLSKGYHPTTLVVPSWYYSGINMFSLADVEIMRRDYQVSLGLLMLKSPMFTLEWSVKAKNPEVAKYIDQTMRNIWKPNIMKLLRACEYGYAACEVIYKLKPDGKIWIETLKEFHPRDVRALSIDHELVGFRVKHVEGVNDVDLLSPKGVWFAINREFGGFYGRSLFLNVWDSWFEKRSKDGAIDIRRLWFYKNAFTGGVIRHPIKDYVMPDGTIYAAREMAREQGEKMKTGAVIAFPNVKDEQGNYQWTYEAPVINGNATEIREYPKDLDNEILRGLGIPDTVVTDPNGGGSYAGRRVPERAFYVRLEMIISELMHVLVNQAFKPAVGLNFEGDIDFEIITKPLVEIMSPEGTPPAGVEGGVNGEAGNIGNNNGEGTGTTVGGVFNSAIQDIEGGLVNGGLSSLGAQR